MSSFKRRTTAKQAEILTPGTRISQATPQTIVTSTGIPSLDDILGGGLPLSCLQTILAPDAHSAYGELVQKYFVAQGLASGHRVVVIDTDPRLFVEECLWLAKGAAPSSLGEAVPATGSLPSGPEGSITTTGDEDEDGAHATAHADDAKIKIAWRYEQMKRFQTTVAAADTNSDEYCRTFDLTTRMPAAVIDEALAAKRLLLDVPSNEISTLSTTTIIARLEAQLQQMNGKEPTRICVPALGSAAWGELRPHELLGFVHALRVLVRQHPRTCASLGMPAHLCDDRWAGPGWTQKVGWLSDACVSFAAFAADPSLSAVFPAYHGLVHILTLPAPHTLQPPSDRFSTLRGLSAAGGAGGSGENNLAFKCMRKRLVIETLHLDVEGGVGERRTTPSISVHDAVPATESVQTRASGASIEVSIEEEVKTLPLASPVPPPSVGGEKAEETTGSVKRKKVKKSVAFASGDRPELDF